MKIGLVARAEDRGLGIQTWEWARAMRPDRVLVVDCDNGAHGYPMHLDRFGGLGASVVVLHHTQMGSDAVRPWLDGLDVVYAVETFYDWRFCDIAHGLGVATVCHMNPEFYKHDGDARDDRLTHPTEWWLPTPWLAEALPATRVMPVPVPLDRWPEPVDAWRSGPLRLLHVVGKRAMADRNGTLALLRAVRMLRCEVEVTVLTQERRLPSPGRTARGVAYRSVLGGTADYWRMYAGHHVLVMPRRFGGLCLPVLEAAGAGLGVVMPQVSPNEVYPATLLPAAEAASIVTGFGAVPTCDIDVHAFVALVHDLAADRDRVRAMQHRARRWAEDHAWSHMADEYRAALADAAAKMHA